MASTYLQIPPLNIEGESYSEREMKMKYSHAQIHAPASKRLLDKLLRHSREALVAAGAEFGVTPHGHDKFASIVLPIKLLPDFIPKAAMLAKRKTNNSHRSRTLVM